MGQRDRQVFEYEYDDETGTVDVNLLGSVYGASIEDYPEVMSRVINILQEVPDASSIVLSESRDYEYDQAQVKLLKEIAEAIRDISSQGHISQNIRTDKCETVYRQKLPEVQRIVVDDLRKDPIGAYVQLKRMKRHLKQEKENSYPQQQRCLKYFTQDVVKPVMNRLEECELIQQAIQQDYLTGYHVGDRDAYREFFHPLVRPNFMLTKFMSLPPERGEEIDRYESQNDVEVSIYKVPDQVQPVYHVNPPEFNLPEEKYRLMDAARRFLASHDPESGEFARPERMREVFQNIGRDMIRDIAEQMNINLSGEDIEELTSILNRYTSGLGVLELLLSDPKIQDVYINSPIGNSPIYISHQDYEECETNLIPTKEEAESWATRFRIQSGRPLDEANPVLDTDTEVPGGRARVAIIQESLSPEGLAFAFRRHRSRAWTLPLFIDSEMINPLGAALLSFIVDGNRSVLFAGTRGAGKCVKGDTMIQLSNGEIKEIKEMVGKQKKEIDDGTIHKPDTGGKALSLSKDNTINHRNISDVWKRESPDKILRIKTESGREIVTTPEHPYFTYQDERIKIRADQLDKGDHIATPRNYEVNTEIQKIKLNEDRQKFQEKDNHYLIKGETNSQEFRLPKRLTPELAEFLGLIVGDGHLTERKIEFHNECEKLHTKFKNVAKELNLNSRKYKSHTTTVSQITCRNFSRILNNIFSIPFNKKSGKVKIPDIILKSPDHVLKEFLKGYFAADSYVAEEKREIELATASEDMKKQLRMTLLRYGITIYTKKKQIEEGTYHRIFIRGKFADKFAGQIGISHPEKQKKLEQHLKSSSLKNTNIDVVPGANPQIKQLRQKLRINTKEFRECGKDYWAYENNEYNVSRKWLKNISKHFEHRWQELENMESQAKILEKFIERDYQEAVHSLSEIKKLLNISYETLATDIEMTETGMRQALKKGRLSPKILENLDVLTQKLNKEIQNIDIKAENNDVESLPEMVDTGLLNYKQISNNTGIPTTSVKNYAYGEVTPPKERRKKIEQEIYLIKKQAASKLQEAEKTLDKIDSPFTEATQIMAALKHLKDELNIERKEFDGLHDQTVSTVFNGRYEPEIETLHSLAETVVEVYREAKNEETRKMLDKIKKRAESDIFWDKIKEIKRENPEEDIVYDLTVEKDHNFVANGFIAHNTSLLSASMLEILKKHRIVTVEDTLELPVKQMKDLGYNIESMKAQSVITQVESELDAAEAIRTSLRLGDSALVIGEVRSDEAKSLYEAMRVGAVANFVGGTIHGEDAYSVFDRVVNDLNVPRTSFKATDIIVSVNKIRSPDGLNMYRRVTGITEVRKNWTEDPQEEGAFVDLMRYDSNKDELVPTDTLLNGESLVLNNIAENIREWKNNWEAVWENIQLRKDIKKAIVEKAEKTGNKELLEAEFVVKANQRFHILAERVGEEYGEQEPERIYARWKEWLDQQA